MITVGASPQIGELGGSRSNRGRDMAIFFDFSRYSGRHISAVIGATSTKFGTLMTKGYISPICGEPPTEAMYMKNCLVMFST